MKKNTTIVVTPVNFMHPNEDVDFTVRTIKAPFIHLHYFSVTQYISAVHKYVGYLSKEERERGDAYRFAADRHRFYVGRIAVRLLISNLLNVSVKDIMLTTAQNKKPVCRNLLNEQFVIHFNISHNEDAVVVALATVPVGVDVEQAKPFDYAALLPNTFADNEVDCIAKSADPTATFFMLWTRKEAVLKANGCGLIDALPALKIVNGIHTLPHHILQDNSTYQVHSFSLPDRYTMSVSYIFHEALPVLFFTNSKWPVEEQ